MVETSRTVTDEEEFASPLIYAVALSSPENVKLLIEAGSDVDTGVVDGITPLMLAAALNSTAMVNLLLEAGAQLDDQAGEIANLYLPGTRNYAVAEYRRNLPPSPVEGASALWLAARAGHVEVVSLLLQAGADGDLEASCGQPGKEVDSDRTCTAQQVAALVGHRRVADLIASPPPEKDGSPAGTAANMRTLLQGRSSGKAE